MLKALSFLVKLALLTAVLVGFSRFPGAVHAEWMGYAVDTTVGFLAAVFLLFLALWTLFYRFWRGVVLMPKALRRARAARVREKGYRDMTSGLVAVAAGDAAGAMKYAALARKSVPDAPLARLLDAQALLLGGNALQARLAFAALLEDQNAAFLGVRGLLQEALDSGDFRAALEHARKAEKLQPSRAWIARTLFGLETRNGQWKNAENTLKKCVRLGVFNAQTALCHRQALLLAQADADFAGNRPVAAHKQAARAFALDPAFTPAATRLAAFYRHVGKTRGADKVLLKAYAASPHPDIARLWMEGLAPSKRQKSPYDAGKDALARAEKLSALHPAHACSLRLTGDAALEAGQFRAAREYAEKTADYPLLARIEQAESGNDARARAWLEKAAEQPPGPQWACASCGHAAGEWNPSCRNCGEFNALVFAVPAQGTPEKHRMPDALLTPPG